jgi:hypothetical protein
MKINFFLAILVVISLALSNALAKSLLKKSQLLNRDDTHSQENRDNQGQDSNKNGKEKKKYGSFVTGLGKKVVEKALEKVSSNADQEQSQ